MDRYAACDPNGTDQEPDNDAGQSIDRTGGRPAQPGPIPTWDVFSGRQLPHRTHDDRHFRWSAWVWSPPPESNRRPHPYHGTTRNRCADRRFPSWRPTVGAKVIGSLSAQLCALFQRCALWPRMRKVDPPQLRSALRSVRTCASPGTGPARADHCTSCVHRHTDPVSQGTAKTCLFTSG
jgi:hypothetical protein